MRARTLALATAVAGLAAGLLSLPQAASAAAAAGPADFNGDGYADIAVGVPAGAAGGVGKAGYVNVVWGTASGPGSASVRVSQAGSGVPGTAEKGDRFGAGLAAADIDEDGYSDLVVGSPGESLDSEPTHTYGAVSIVWGGPAGFRGGFTAAKGVDEFSSIGRTVAAGDYDHDGQQDIALSRLTEETGGVGLRRGPFTAGSPTTYQNIVGYGMSGATHALATGDFDGDGTDDLAVTYKALEDRGTAIMRWSGPGAFPDRYWVTSGAGDSLAAGDFDADGTDDLAIGLCTANPEVEPPRPCEEHPGGLVRVAYGSASGGFGTRLHDITQATAGVPGTAEAEDDFGASVAAGDVDHDGHADLVAGNPEEAIGSLAAAGDVIVIRGRAGGLLGADGADAVGFNQATAGVPGAAEAGDRFGAAVRALDVGADGHADVLAGSPGENASSGGVWYLPGSTLDALTGAKALTPANLGLPAPASALAYGAVLAG